MAFLTYEGAHAGSTTTIDIPPPQNVMAQGSKMVAEYNAGRQVAAQAGCLACHKIGESGNSGPGPNLTKVGRRLPRQAIARTLINPTAPMPSFKQLPPAKFNALVTFVSSLR